MERWTDKLIVVTGASRGIGKAIVAELAKYPVKIVGLARNIEGLQGIADGLKSLPGKMYPIKCDLTNESDILKAFEWIDTELGQGVSVLINNAGTLIKSKILDGDIEDWKHMYDLNVIALTVCCRECHKSMTKYGITDGHVININSTAGHTMLPLPGHKLYNSTKTAVTYLTEGYRHELIAAGVKTKVTSISPGRVWTSESPKAEQLVAMKPERVASMVIVALTTPSDVVIAELTVLSVGETLQSYPQSLIK
ncbi:dehydrogenase/reductase SDR family member 11-like [Adelges cooleyi]|uniref:dehydrogenase/reductase SDR family member 11-like n=1 Tax=Adelges cooleyi TaxID=133065 RepID=UPI00217F8163|nr:dehydrogenase/reductase SDR family member 11-like [Adelges cooleyi]